MDEATRPSPDGPRAGATGLNGPAGREAPDGQGKASGGLWGSAAKRTIAEFTDDQLSDRAAALTYYSVLSIFPGLLVVVSLLGLFGTGTKPLVDNLTQAAPSNVQQIIKPVTANLQNGHASAGFAAILGIVLAVWSASAYIAAFMRASNVIYDVPEGRPFWKTTPARIGVTVLILVMLVASALIDSLHNLLTLGSIKFTEVAEVRLYLEVPAVRLAAEHKVAGLILDAPYTSVLELAAASYPFLPVRAGLGSDVLRADPGLRTVTSPYADPSTGVREEFVAMPALRLDAALVHMNRADRLGNGQYLGPDPYFDDLFCEAADAAYVSCERIVDTADLVKEAAPPKR